MEDDKIKEQGKVLIEWPFPEYEIMQRGKAWYLVASVAVVLLLLYALVTVNFLFAVIIIMSAIILLLKEKFNPEEINFAITENGIAVDGRFYNYDLFHSFYIIYKPGEIKKVYLNFKSVLKPRLGIPLFNQDPLKVKELLNKHITENIEREHEPASETFKKVFKL